MQQGALARAAGPDDGHELAPSHLEVHVREDLEGAPVATLVDLAHPVRGEDRGHSCRMASTGVKREAEREGGTVATTASRRLATTTIPTSTASMCTGR